MYHHQTVQAHSVEHLAKAVLEDFEQEFWSGRHSRSHLAAAPIQAAARHILPSGYPLDPPEAPPINSDPEHRRLYGDALAAWTQLQHARSRFNDLAAFLQREIP